MPELLGGGRKLQLLGAALVVLPDLLDFFHGGLLAQGHEHRCHVAVGDGDTEALSGDLGGVGVDDDAVLDVTPHLHGFLLRFFFLAADVGDDVIHHLRPGLEGLAGAGDGLIGADQRLFYAELLPQRMQGGDVALEGAVGLDSDEAALGAQTLLLMGDDLDMFRIDLRHHHGHVRGEPVGGIVGDNRAFHLSDPLLQGAGGVLIHIHRTEGEVDLVGELLHLSVDVVDDQLFGFLGDGGVHLPAAADGFFIGFSGAAGTGRNGGELEPGVVLQQRDKALTYHASTTDNAYFVFFHLKLPPKNIANTIYADEAILSLG